MPNERIRSTAQAIFEATDIALASDPRVFLMGEGVSDPKGIFGTTLGLAEKYGHSRVVETPISENGFTGIAIGCALMGQRPILVHQRVEFCLLAMEQLVNNAAKLHYVTNGDHKVPMVVRLVVGRGWGQGPQHSQSLETLFSYIPGLKVVMPALPGDAKGMLLAAIEDNNPVIFIEHRWSHYGTGHVPIEASLTSLDCPARLETGDDVTVVATSYMVLESLQAVNVLSRYGVSVELFDLRVLRPLNLNPIIESVKKTGRLIFIDTGWKMFGIGAEAVSQVVESCFADLRSPPQRIGLPDHPTPSSKSLAGAFYPRSEEIAGSVCDLVGCSTSIRERVLAEIGVGRGDIPPDIPHPSFRGPF